MQRIRVDIYSDTGCPWCYIGNKYLDLAIEQYTSRHPDAVFELAWHPFFLFPNAKVSAYNRADLYHKIMGPDRAAGWFRSLDAAAGPLGIRFDWSGRTGHTGDSHKLLLRASDLGRAASPRGGGGGGGGGLLQQQQQQPGAAEQPSSDDREATSYPSPPRDDDGGDGDGDGDGGDHGDGDGSPDESSDNTNNTNDTNNDSTSGGSAPLRRLLRHMFEGSFERGRDVSDRAFLAEAAVAAGVAADAADALRWLDHPGSAVRLAAGTARGAEAEGVAAVPCFVVQGKFKVGGAQPPGVFLALFDRLGGEGRA
ncbi:hypothetical protein RB595_003096 [Gaeumannomyces hyphopodioides]